MQGNWLHLFARRRPLWLPSVDRSPRVILACCANISRNLRGMLFPPFGGQSAQAETVCHILHTEISRLPGWDNVTQFEPRLMPPLHRAFMRERGLFPASFCTIAHDGLALLHQNQQACCYLNDRDHLRVASWSGDLSLPPLLEDCQRVIDALTGRLDFCRDDYYGHLCRDAMRCGAGVSMEVVLHLPALALTPTPTTTNHRKQLSQIIDACQESGNRLKVHPKYEDGALYLLQSGHIPRQGALAAAKRLAELAERIRDCELNERRRLAQQEPVNICDLAGRAYGLARSAHRISDQEMRNCLSAIWLGRECGLFRETDTTPLQDLFGNTGRASLAMLFPERAASPDWPEELCDLLRIGLLQKGLGL